MHWSHPEESVVMPSCMYPTMTCQWPVLAGSMSCSNFCGKKEPALREDACGSSHAEYYDSLQLYEYEVLFEPDSELFCWQVQLKLCSSIDIGLFGLRQWAVGCIGLHLAPRAPPCDSSSTGTLPCSSGP